MTVKHGDTIGEIDCPSCGRKTPLKINAAGNVYFFCAKVTERDHSGKATERCYTRFNWGKLGSRKMIADYLKNKPEEVLSNENTENQPIQPEPEQRPAARECGSDGDRFDRPEPSPAVERAGDQPADERGSLSFGARLAYFLTGDA